MIFIEQFFSSQTSPHERFYQFSVILISLIVAIVLEVIIRFTDQFIGQSLTELSDQLIDNTIDDELTNHQKHLKAKCETFIEFFIKALLCCGVYFVTYIILIIIINSKTPDPKYFISLAIVEFVAYFIIQWIIDFMTVKIGTHKPINYTPSGKVGTWLNSSFGTQKTVNNIFVTITNIFNIIPKWVWLLLVYTICPMIASLFFKISDITSLDEFYWQFASSIVTFLFSNIITKSKHT